MLADPYLIDHLPSGSQRRTNRSPVFWRLACKFVPEIKKIQEKKVMHAQALQLLRFICSEIAKLDGKRVRDLIGHPLEAAATIGNVEVVEQILASFPNALFLVNENKHGVFQIAIANRKADVFNLIYQITTPHHLLLAQRDASYNTALHLVAHLVEGTPDQASLHLRSYAPGAALQMQRELEWFKGKKPKIETIYVEIDHEEDCSIIDVEEDFNAPMFVQHTESMLEEIDKMDEDFYEEQILDIDDVDKNDPLAVVEYVDEIYAYYKKQEDAIHFITISSIRVTPIV